MIVAGSQDSDGVDQNARPGKVMCDVGATAGRSERLVDERRDA
jgi:hypothetical protein